MPLVPQVVDAVGDRVPVVAAGGIFDGRGLAAALALGADGVWVGHPVHRHARGALGARATRTRSLRTAEDGTVISRAFTGKTLRAVANDTTRHFEAHPDELVPFPEMLMKSMSGGWMHLGAHEGTEGVDPDRECYPAGQGVGAIDALVPAGDVVRRIVAEAEAALDRLAAIPR